MEVLDIIAGIVFACCLLLLVIVWRRTLLRRRGATLDLCVRAPGGRGWALGVGRFTSAELEWFRIFSLSPRPRRSFARPGLSVVDRRRPTSSEVLALMAGAVVVSCDSADGRVELAMDESALTGFLAWLEAAPPGAAVPSVPDGHPRH